MLVVVEGQPRAAPRHDLYFTHEGGKPLLTSTAFVYTRTSTITDTNAFVDGRSISIRAKTQITTIYSTVKAEVSAEELQSYTRAVFSSGRSYCCLQAARPFSEKTVIVQFFEVAKSCSQHHVT